MVWDFSAHRIDSKEQELPIIFGIPCNRHPFLNSRAEEEAVENSKFREPVASSKGAGFGKGDRPLKWNVGQREFLYNRYFIS